MPRGFLAKAGQILRSWSEEQLAGLVRAKRLHDRKADLERERARLAASLEKVDGNLKDVEREIAEVLGQAAVRRTRRKAGKAGRRQAPLRDFVLAALKKAARPLRLSELAEAVRKIGYRTRSAAGGFRVSVAHLLARMRGEIAKIGEGYAARTRAKRVTVKAARTKRKTAAKARTQESTVKSKDEPNAAPQPGAAAGSQ